MSTPRFVARLGACSVVLILGFAFLAPAPSAAQPCPPCPGDEEPGEEGEMHVFFGYLHAHSGYSDGQGTPLEAYVHARDLAGLDFLTLTPHNHSSAGRIATEPDLYNGPGPDALIQIASSVTQDGVFVALYGQEFSSISKGNHVNVLDAPTVIGVENGRFDELADTFLPANKDSFGNDCLLVLNHPDSGPRSREYGRDDFGTEAEWVRRMDALASMINLINGPSHDDGQADIPQPEEGSFRFFLNKGFHLAPSIDQDNHRKTWGTIHDGRTAVVAPELTKEALLDALRARHAYATTDRNLRIVCHVDDGLCGDVFPAPPVGSPVQVTLDIRDDDEPDASYQVSVFTDEIGGSFIDLDDPIEEVLVDGDGSFDLPQLSYAGGNAYYLIKVAQFNVGDDSGEETDRVWLAPFWLEPPAGPEGVEIAGPETEIDAVAHRHSEVFHTTDCPQAGVIPAEERLEGAEAVVGRTPHGACTGLVESR